ncbi:MAG: acyl carrier protein [Candidatus Omnitrophota bacterium]|nr:acyl carrier protein [Candidatus Omnitrophota bacterium]
MAVLDEVKEILVSELGVKPEMVTLEAKLREDLGADSLDRAEAVSVLEERFEISITDEDVTKVVSVRDIVELVTQKLQAKSVSSS